MTADSPTTVFVDPSALVLRYVEHEHRGLVIDTMASAAHWCASALARSEMLMALHRIALDQFHHDELWTRFRDEWDSFIEVPVDERCLARAAEIGATYGVRTVDAIHLAAAARLPQPVRYLSFDRRQLLAAGGLGFEVIAPRTDLP